MKRNERWRRFSWMLLFGLLLGLASLGSLMPAAARPALQQAEYEVVLLGAPGTLTYTAGEGLGVGQGAGAGRIPGSTYPDQTHAILWPAGSSVGVDLHPAGFRTSAALDSDGQRQVGHGSGPSTGYYRHALLWNGSAGDRVDLHPAGQWNDSSAVATAGDQQVGNINYYFYTSYERIIVEHAALWRGSAASVVDLHPTDSGCQRSYAVDTDGSRQVGHAYCPAVPNTAPYQALLWSGTAGSAVVLHPTGYTHSFAEGIHGGEQVGYAFNYLGDGYSRALLWRGTAASVVELHPDGYLGSAARATNGIHQVGSGADAASYQSHALRWSGTAGSVLDLHAFLPTEFSQGSSEANDIDAAGNIIGVAQRPDGSHQAVLWRPVAGAPAPTPLPTPQPTTTPAPEPDPEPSAMLANGSFELDANNDGRPDDWTPNSKFTRTSAEAIDGSYAGMLAATDDSSASIGQRIANVTSGAAYSFEGRVNIPATGDSFRLRLLVRWRDASNRVISTTTVRSYSAGTSGWDAAQASLVAPAGATQAEVVMVANSLNTTIYVDGFLFAR